MNRNEQHNLRARMNSFLMCIEKSTRYGLTEEVRTTPKPGLVDCKDNGAHKDMDLHTFEISIETVTPYIVEMAKTGFLLEDGLQKLFPRIRKIGVKAEAAMLEATGGINTHKGVLFSMGIIAAALGFYYRLHIAEKNFPETEDIFLLSQKTVNGYLEKDFSDLSGREPKTHGEKLFIQYGIKGIRGEAMEGFPSLALVALPAMREAKKTQPDFNAVKLKVLLTLMSTVNDTNILARSNWMTLMRAKACSKIFLDRYPVINQRAVHKLEDMNSAFIRQNISPGGCADLLAIAIFLKNWKVYGREFYNQYT